MQIQTIFLLVAFNLIVWFIAISRLIALGRETAGRQVALIFLVGILAQGIHSVILAGSVMLIPYISGRILNAVETSFAVLSAYFLFVAISVLLNYATKLDGHSLSCSTQYRNILLSPKLNFGTLIFMIICLVITVTIEFGLAGTISNSLTPSSLNLKSNFLLLANRIITMSFIVIVESLIAISLIAILRTDYGKRSSVRIRTWSAIVIVWGHGSHFVVNMIATLLIFVVGMDSIIGKTVYSTYILFDTLILIPLGIGFFVAVGPTYLIDKVDETLTVVWFWRCQQQLKELRDLLVAKCPDVEFLTLMSPHMSAELPTTLSYTIMRYTIECSDAIRMLLKSLTYAERDMLLSLISDGVNNYEIEARLIDKALEISDDPLPIQTNSLDDCSELPSFSATTLPELVAVYLELARILKMYRSGN